ncbi:hypothetical protein FB45DRAFT_1032565 [Roridomyces roridus]|uniref:Transmembrane protein n=1 Tax=Roridomyces roridus TaxID=1738132 RepID=A0AAD7BHK3_9AGAR|nr:hypothetical protein FB45DRAFT_1032565 [Roridomyces roridus]
MEDGKLRIYVRQCEDERINSGFLAILPWVAFFVVLVLWYSESHSRVDRGYVRHHQGRPLRRRGMGGSRVERAVAGVVDWIAGMARPVPEAMPSNARRTRNFRNGRGTNRGRPHHNRPTEVHNDRGEVVGHRWSPAVQHYLDDRMVWTETAARGPSPSRSTHSSMPSLVDIETPTTGTTSAVTKRPVEGVIDYEDEYDSAQNPTEPKEAHWSEVQTPWTAVDATVISTGAKTA